MRLMRALLLPASGTAPAASQGKPPAEMSAEELDDQKRGGLLGEAERLRKERPEDRKNALEELKKFPKALRQIYDAPRSQGARIQAAARAEGLEKPGE